MVRKDKAGGERRVVELFSQLEVWRGLEALLRLLVNTRSGGPHLRKMFGDRLERRRLWRNLMSGMCCQMQCPSCRRSWRRMIRQLRLLAEISSNSCP